MAAGKDVQVREAMDHPDTASFAAAKITIANWYSDRAAQSAGETSSRYVHYARQACDIVSQLLPTGTLDDTCQRVHGICQSCESGCG
jgi:hypothetical protein